MDQPCKGRRSSSEDILAGTASASVRKSSRIADNRSPKRSTAHGLPRSLKGSCAGSTPAGIEPYLDPFSDADSGGDEETRIKVRAEAENCLDAMVTSMRRECADTLRKLGDTIDLSWK